jgi:hypothetical protein
MMTLFHPVPLSALCTYYPKKGLCELCVLYYKKIFVRLRVSEPLW